MYLSTVRSDGRGRGRWWLRRRLQRLGRLGRWFGRRLRGGGLGGGFGGFGGFGFEDSGGLLQPRLRDIQDRPGTPRPFTRRSMSSISRPFSTGWTDALASWRGAVATIMRVAIARAYRLGVPVVLLVLRALAVLERVGLGRKAKHRGREARVGSECLATEYPGACGKGAEAMRRWWHGKHRAGRRRAGRRGAGTRRGEAGVA
eukprot:scaffold49341_cov63-Phaeocystis_antarctica.AAC.1